MKPLKINLDIKQNSYEELELMQGYSYPLEATILDGGQAFDLTGQVVTVEMLKADNTFIIQSEGITTKGNVSTIVLHKDFNRIAGMGKLQIVLRKDTLITGSWVINARVKAAAINKAVGESGNVVTIKEELDKTILEAIEENKKTEQMIATGGAASKGDIIKINEQLEHKTNNRETILLQNQINNLVLGAVGDGNNAEVVASRGSYSLLNNRLDDFDVKTDTLINNRNVLSDRSIRTKSWSVTSGDYNIVSGSNFSNAILLSNGVTKISMFKDIPISAIPSGDYVFSFKCLNTVDFNLFASVSIIGYPTSVNSGGTVLYTIQDLRCYNIELNKGYQKNDINFNINTTNYHHCRLIIECRTLNQTYNFTDVYLGLKNTVCNDFSYIDYRFNLIDSNIKLLDTNLQNNNLKGKTLYLNGDSITFGAGYSGGYGKILSDKYGCIITNNAISGGTLATGTTYGDGTPRHYISTDVVSKVNKNYDYMILSGGFNDYGNNVPIGVLSNSEFNFTNPITTDNVIGAIETMFRHIMQNYPTTKLYFLITHKANRCTNQVNAIGKTMQDYVNAIKTVCERYSIPMINIWEKSRMLTVYDNIASTYTMSSDRVHPNQLGYENFYLPVIEKEIL